MIGFSLTAAILVIGAGEENPAWALECEGPTELLIREMREPPKLDFPIPGSPGFASNSKRPWVTVSLAPDIVSFEEAGYHRGQSYSFSNVTSARGFKGQILKRLGLMEVKSRGFGATLRFASAPNWAFQFKGTKQVTVAYITRF